MAGRSGKHTHKKDNSPKKDNVPKKDNRSRDMNNGGSGDVFDVRKVRRLVELMNEHELAEVDLRQGDQRIRLRRGQEPVVTMGAAPVPVAPAPAAAAAPAATPSSRRCRRGSQRRLCDQPDGRHVLCCLEPRVPRTCKRR